MKAPRRVGPQSTGRVGFARPGRCDVGRPARLGRRRLLFGLQRLRVTRPAVCEGGAMEVLWSWEFARTRARTWYLGTWAFSRKKAAGQTRISLTETWAARLPRKAPLAWPHIFSAVPQNASAKKLLYPTCGPASPNSPVPRTPPNYLTCGPASLVPGARGRREFRTGASGRSRHIAPQPPPGLAGHTGGTGVAGAPRCCVPV
jgi:hypothetical protein